MWTSAKSRRTPVRRPDPVLAGSHNTASSSKGRDMQGEPDCYPLPCSTATNKTQRSPGSKHPSCHMEVPVTGSLPAVTERGMKASSTVRFPLSQGQLPGDFLWCGDKGQGKEGPLLFQRNPGLPVIPSLSPALSPQRLTGNHSAHSKRPPSVGEKLSPFISIHIHP